MKFLQRLANKNLTDIITVFKLEFGRLCIYYLPKQPFSNPNVEKLTSFIQNEILQEVISLPHPRDQSKQLETELKDIRSTTTRRDNVLMIYGNRCLRNKEKDKIILFSHYKEVIEIKKQILNKLLSKRIL